MFRFVFYITLSSQWADITQIETTTELDASLYLGKLYRLSTASTVDINDTKKKMVFNMGCLCDIVSVLYRAVSHTPII